MEVTVDTITETELIIPTGPNLIGIVNDNIVSNLLRGNAPQLDFPSSWRLAKLVVTENAPLIIYRTGT